MDKMIIYSKIESLERCLNRIKSKTPRNAEILKSDLDCQDIIVLNLERAVQVCVDLASYIIADLEVKTPMSMADCFRQLHESKVITESTVEKMIKSVGFRNVAVHEYSKVDWDIVFAIAKHQLSDFKRYAREIVDWMEAS